jgi:hypothetical protein
MSRLEVEVGVVDGGGKTNLEERVSYDGWRGSGFWVWMREMGESGFKFF